MGQHHLDPLNWLFGKDDTSPVEIEASAPPAHPEVTGMWGWVRMKYADGFTLVLESGEWGQPSGMQSRAERLAAVCGASERGKLGEAGRRLAGRGGQVKTLAIGGRHDEPA